MLVLYTYSQLDRVDLTLELARLVGGHTSSNNGSGNATSASESNLAGNKHVRHVLISDNSPCPRKEGGDAGQFQ